MRGEPFIHDDRSSVMLSSLFLGRWTRYDWGLEVKLYDLSRDAQIRSLAGYRSMTAVVSSADIFNLKPSIVFVHRCLSTAEHSRTQGESAVTI